ncbi:MAG TPA: hypothetical protein VGX28_12535 [Frankiaceae bacterium]|jgi:hypothetical protein|nr:hypothetical protein [Frankiaceae bacterium]
MKRSLSLRREALSELTFDELGHVAGGAATGQGATCPLKYCVTGVVSNGCATDSCCTGSASC